MHQPCKVSMITNHHFYSLHCEPKRHREKESEQESELVRDGLYHRELLPLGDRVWELYQSLSVRVKRENR